MWWARTKSDKSDARPFNWLAVDERDIDWKYELVVLQLRLGCDEADISEKQGKKGYLLDFSMSQVELKVFIGSLNKSFVVMTCFVEKKSRKWLSPSQSSNFMYYIDANKNNRIIKVLHSYYNST